MKTTFKDVAHLYLGCKMYVFPVDTIADGWLGKQLIKHQNLKYTCDFEVDSFTERLDDGYLPILRPLSDMTDEEALYFFENYKFGEIQINGTATEIDFGKAIAKRVAEQSRFINYLRARHIDTDGLIESGQAIDAATLPNNPIIKHETHTL